MNINDLIKGAMMDIGVVASGETPSADDYNDVLRKLNSMLGRWGSKSLLIPASVSESFSLVASTAQYTMGSAGTASSVRAVSILSAFIRDSGNIDHHVDIISERQFNEIPNKALTGRPYLLFYDPGATTGYINFYYTPDSTETAYIESVKPLTEIALSGVTGTFNLPREYEEAVQLNLAIRIGPMFGKPASPKLEADALEAYDDILALNAANKYRRQAQLDVGIPGIASAKYDINAG